MVAYCTDPTKFQRAYNYNKRRRSAVGTREYGIKTDYTEAAGCVGKSEVRAFEVFGL